MTFRDTNGEPIDYAVTAFLGAMPEERRDELRAQVRAARERQARGARRGDAGDGRDNASGDDLDVAFGNGVADELDDEFDDEFADGFADELEGTEEHAVGTVAPAGPPRPLLGDEDARPAASGPPRPGRRAHGRQALGAPARTVNPPVRVRHEPAAAASAAGAGEHIIRLSEIQPQRLRWLSRGRLAAGKITILDGDPGLGKSTLLCELTARITQGEALPYGEPGAPRAVVMMSAEDDLHDTIRPRLDAAGGDPARVFAFTTVPAGKGADRPFLIPGDVPFLELLVSRLRAALVIVDPFVAFLDGRLSANNDQDVRRALAALKGVAERTGAAVVAVRHLNKTTSANPLYRGGGSIGIIGAARCGLLLAADPENPERRILAATKGNLARPPASLAFRLADVPGSDVARVVWEGESRWTAQSLLTAREEGDEDRSALEEARAWLRDALAQGPRPARDLTAEAEAQAISTATLKRARRAEAIVARKDRTCNGGWTWALPERAREEVHAPPLEILEPLGPLEPLRVPEQGSTTSEVVQVVDQPAPWES